MTEGEQPSTTAHGGELTDEPAQNGQEFRMGGELLRDRAPKDSATMDPPSSSCNNPRESSGRPGSSRDPLPVIRDEADKPRGRFRCGGSLCGAAPVTGQQDPGSTTGSDIPTDWKENPRMCGISARKGLCSRTAGWVPLPSWWAVLNNTLTERHRCWAHFHIVWQPVQSVRTGEGQKQLATVGHVSSSSANQRNVFPSLQAAIHLSLTRSRTDC
eukprot:XP_011613535.1 PREDICTED: uncharacterized protein LOC105417992 isoform X1 [Takifugu rubripes]